MCRTAFSDKDLKVIDMIWRECVEVGHGSWCLVDGMCVFLSTWETERRLTLCFQTRTIRERESKECVIDEAGLRIDTKMAVFRR